MVFSFFYLPHVGVQVVLSERITKHTRTYSTNTKHTALRCTGHSEHKTRTPNLKYPDPDPKYPNPHYPMPSSDSESYYPNLYWVIRVSTPGTRTTRNKNTSQRSVNSRTRASPISRGPSPTTVGCLFSFGASLTHVLTDVMTGSRLDA
jgi:hypothetical protein